MLFALLAVILVPGFSERASAMEKMSLFSPVSGVVLNHGQPVAGATLERSYYWGWNSQRGHDTVTTDNDGQFSFSAIWGRSFFASWLPHEPFVEQKIRIMYQEKSYDAWVYTKRSYGLNDELYGQSTVLKCDLANKARRHTFKKNHDVHVIYGICEMPGMTELDDGKAEK